MEANRLCNPPVLRMPQFQREATPRKADTTRLTAAAISIRIASAVAKRYIMNSHRGMMCGS